MSLLAVDRASPFYGRARLLLPGVLLSFTIAAAATFLGEHYTAPVMLFALLIGMAFYFLSAEGRCAPGIEFTAKRLLRIGVALLGAQVTLEQIYSLGAGPIVIVLLCIGVTIGAGLTVARLFGRSWGFGLLTGGAVAICGASAALAISAVLPKTSGSERDTLFTVIAVTALSTIAMVIYPLLYDRLGFDNVEIGVLIGATIHDVAQVIGAGYAISPETGEIAVYVKLLRVAFLPVVVIAIAFATSSRDSSVTPVPLFAVAFGIILLANSADLIPASLGETMSATSRWLLVSAIAALGMKTSLSAMFSLGPGHVVILALETVVLAGIAVCASLIL